MRCFTHFHFKASFEKREIANSLLVICWYGGRENRLGERSKQKNVWWVAHVRGRQREGFSLLERLSQAYCSVVNVVNRAYSPFGTLYLCEVPDTCTKPSMWPAKWYSGIACIIEWDWSGLRRDRVGTMSGGATI